MDKHVEAIWIVWHNELADSMGVKYTKQNFEKNIALPTFGAITHFGKETPETFPEQGKLMFRWYQCKPDKRDPTSKLCSGWEPFGGAGATWSSVELNKASLAGGLLTWTKKDPNVFQDHTIFGEKTIGSRNVKFEVGDAYTLNILFFKFQWNNHGLADPSLVTKMNTATLTSQGGISMAPCVTVEQVSRTSRSNKVSAKMTAQVQTRTTAKFAVSAKSPGLEQFEQSHTTCIPLDNTADVDTLFRYDAREKLQKLEAVEARVFADETYAKYVAECQKPTACSFEVDVQQSEQFEGGNQRSVCLTAKHGIPDGGVLSGEQAVTTLLINLGYTVGEILDSPMASALYEKVESNIVSQIDAANRAHTYVPERKSYEKETALDARSFAVQAADSYAAECRASPCSFNDNKVCLTARHGIPDGGKLSGEQAIITVMINLGYSVGDIFEPRVRCSPERGGEGGECRLGPASAVHAELIASMKKYVLAANTEHPQVDKLLSEPTLEGGGGAA